MLKHGILGLLSYSSMSGYDVMVYFRDSLNFFWSANTSQIYRELSKLKENGFVEETEVKQSGKPDKKVFAITKEGREELKIWLRDEDYGNGNSPLCMKTFFAAELTVEENKERFLKIKEKNRQQLEKYDYVEAIINNYAKMVGNPESKLYWAMTLDYGKRYCTMLDEWCDECIQRMEAR